MADLAALVRLLRALVAVSARLSRPAASESGVTAVLPATGLLEVFTLAGFPSNVRKDREAQHSQPVVVRSLSTKYKLTPMCLPWSSTLTLSRDWLGVAVDGESKLVFS